MCFAPEGVVSQDKATTDNEDICSIKARKGGLK